MKRTRSQIGRASKAKGKGYERKIAKLLSEGFVRHGWIYCDECVNALLLDDMVKVKKAMEAKRKDYLKPFQDHVKETNDAFRSLMEPVEIADAVTRGKILAFKAELVRRINEAKEINISVFKGPHMRRSVYEWRTLIRTRIY